MQPSYLPRSRRSESHLAQFRQQVVQQRLARSQSFPSNLLHRREPVIHVVRRHGFDCTAGRDEVLQTEHAGAVDEGVGLLLRFDQRAFEFEGFRESPRNFVAMRFAFSVPTTLTNSSNFRLSQFGELGPIRTWSPLSWGASAEYCCRAARTRSAFRYDRSCPHRDRTSLAAATRCRILR